METYKIFDNAEFSKAESAKEYLSELLEQIDFPKLHVILASFSKAAGREDASLLEKEDIHTEYELAGRKLKKEWLGLYYAHNNSVHVNTEHYRNHIGSLTEYDFLHTIVHESTHALGRKDCEGVEDQYSTGYQQHKQHLYNEGRQRYIKFLEYFNEAVTEKIARQLVKQYIGSDPKREVMMQNEELLEPEDRSYEPYVQFLNQFISKISERTGVSVEVVWEGIVSDYLQGNNLFDTELEKGFEDVFYEGVMYEIGLIDNPEELELILQKMETGQKKGLLDKVVYKIKRKVTGL